MFFKYLLLFELFTQGRAPIDSRRTELANSSESCRDCHREQYEEWRGSRHSMAWNNDFFQHDYNRNKRQWCRNCHSPLQAQQEESAVAEKLRAEGVNCIVCHVRGAQFFAEYKRQGSPHNTIGLSAFGSDTFCEGCHQFRFPAFDDDGALAHYTDEPMQDTVAQFRGGPYAKDKTCRDCHARGAGGHSYPGSHTPAMLREALDFSVCRDGERVRTRLSNVGAGHNVPTGDVHRHVLVKAWRATAPEKLREAFYGRRFRPLVTGGKTTIHDSTIPPQESRDWSFSPAELGGAASEPVRIEVRFLYGSRERYPAPFQEPAYRVVYRVAKPAAALPACGDS